MWAFLLSVFFSLLQNYFSTPFFATSTGPLMDFSNFCYQQDVLFISLEPDKRQLRFCFCLNEVILIFCSFYSQYTLPLPFLEKGSLNFSKEPRKVSDGNSLKASGEVNQDFHSQSLFV